MFLGAIWLSPHSKFNANLSSLDWAHHMQYKTKMLGNTIRVWKSLALLNLFIFLLYKKTVMTTTVIITYFFLTTVHTNKILLNAKWRIRIQQENSSTSWQNRRIWCNKYCWQVKRQKHILCYYNWFDGLNDHGYNTREVWLPETVALTVVRCIRLSSADPS